MQLPVADWKYRGTSSPRAALGCLVRASSTGSRSHPASNRVKVTCCFDFSTGCCWPVEPSSRLDGGVQSWGKGGAVERSKQVES